MREKVGKDTINLGEDFSNTPVVTFETSLVKGGAKIQVTVDRDWDRPVPHERRGWINVTYHSVNEQGKLGSQEKAKLVCVKGGRVVTFAKAHKSVTGKGAYTVCGSLFFLHVNKPTVNI